MPNNFDEQLISQYDELMNAWPHADEFRSKGAEVIRNHIHENPKDRYSVFEIGSGRGELTKKALEIDDRITIIAAEISPFMYLDAQDNLKEYRSRCLLMMVDGLFLADQLSHIDIFMSCWTVHNLRENIRPFLTKAYRLLKPGGLFINLDKYVPINSQEKETMMKKHFERLQVLDPGLRKVAERHEREDLDSEYVQTESDTDFMRKIGFQEVQISNRYCLDAVVTARK